MITFEEFEDFVKDEPGFGRTMNRAAAEATKTGTGEEKAFGVLTAMAGKR